MKKTYTYDERLFANVPPYDSPKAYEMSRDKFDQGAYLESIHYLLDSFNPTARLRYDDELEKKIAMIMTKKNTKVKPGYKKKRAAAIDRVHRQKKREMIRSKIREEKKAMYKERARKDREGLS